MKQTNNTPFGPKQIKAAKKIIANIKTTDRFCQALTHTSYLNEKNQVSLVSYETLEFLGDSILNFYTALFIYHDFPEYSEGQMSKLKQLMVQESTLAYLSKEIGLNEYLLLGVGEQKNQGSSKSSILADIFESFVAALYLEKGSQTVWRFLNLTVFSWMQGKEKMIWDYKSQLQEYCQAQKIKLFYHHLPVERGTDNQPSFVVKAILENYAKIILQCETGRGKSKKEAEQEAASKIITKLKIEPK